jgi:hypothetical protein
MTDHHSGNNELLAFNQELSSWNISKVEDMRTMFINTLPLHQNRPPWNVSHVRYTSEMFFYRNVEIFFVIGLAQES